MGNSLLDFLFPRVCHLCDASLSEREEYICTSCRMRLPRTMFHRLDDNPMEQRFIGKFPFQKATGHFFYSKDSDLSHLMQDLKYRRFRGLARYLGEMVAEELLITGFFSDIDMILPVPMHFIKQARRGYNQTIEIARGITKVTGIPAIQNLKAVRRHHTQTSMTLAERQANIDGIFRLCDSDKISARRFLIVDDVCTTGATLTASAQAILKAIPDASISLLTIGVTF